jgi:hypothetical protein
LSIAQINMSTKIFLSLASLIPAIYYKIEKIDNVQPSQMNKKKCLALRHKMCRCMSFKQKKKVLECTKILP